MLSLRDNRRHQQTMSAPPILTIAVSLALSLRGFAVSYYVNCASGNDASSGLSASVPWRSLDRTNRTLFHPGDSILLARGTRCRGELHPRGSGSPGRIITLADYGSGPLPLIDAGK
ncbi:MAG: right-handed parallel beta-helix repeat-containing protein, partial [Terriglobia bacterium]